MNCFIRACSVPYRYLFVPGSNLAIWNKITNKQVSKWKKIFTAAGNRYTGKIPDAYHYGNVYVLSNVTKKYYKHNEHKLKIWSLYGRQIKAITPHVIMWCGS